MINDSLTWKNELRGRYSLRENFIVIFFVGVADQQNLCSWGTVKSCELRNLRHQTWRHGLRWTLGWIIVVLVILTQ